VGAAVRQRLQRSPLPVAHPRLAQRHRELAPGGSGGVLVLVGGIYYLLSVKK